jgi:hypothetical protein
MLGKVGKSLTFNVGKSWQITLGISEPGGAEWAKKLWQWGKFSGIS